MLQSIGFKLSKNNAVCHKNFIQKNTAANTTIKPTFKAKQQAFYPTSINISTLLNNKEEQQKYEFLFKYLSNESNANNVKNMTPNQELNFLLKNGKLLSRKSNDSTSTLDNLFEIATTPRTDGLDSRILIMNILDNLAFPKLITQKFGDIPKQDKEAILNSLPDNSERNGTIDVENSGTCPAASCEVNLADKYPAEYARWVNKLSSADKQVVSKIKLSSLSTNPLEAVEILDIMKANKKNFTLDSTDIIISADKNAYYRAINQSKNWDPGERNVADVLIQSAIMQTGSQNTYNSLTDIREGEFNTNPQGLIEIEKTYVESILKNREITSLVYQKTDDNQNLVGYNCSFDKIKQHIIDTIDSGEDVIIGYTDTNKTAGRTKLQNYSPEKDGAPNKIINGHEITIVDYKTDPNGKMYLICIDTDDDNPEYVTYDADIFIPKIHHAGYPAKIVEKDAQMILENELIPVA